MNHITTAYYNTTNSQLIINGSNTSLISGNIRTNVLSTMLLANRFLSGGINCAFQGHICEMLFFNGALSIADRQRVEGYLAWKWGWLKWPNSANK